MLDQSVTSEQRQAVHDLVMLGLGDAIVEICGLLQVDGGWLEWLALHEMMAREPI